MTSEALSSIRELDSRVSDGIHVKLLWCQDGGGLWVDVADARSQEAFSIQLREGDRPLDVFHHPYAYAYQRGISTRVEPSHVDERLAA